MKNEYFHEKVVWITGASSGIGWSIAVALAPLAGKLIISGRNYDKLQKLSDQLSPDVKIEVLAFDMQDESMISKTLLVHESLLHEVDIMIHNAGISMRSLVKNTEMEVYRTMMQVNYFSVVQISQFLLPNFIKNKGHFVVINSMAGKFGVPYRSGYSASKMALNGYFGALKAEPEGKSVSVTMVYPGFIHTEISKHALRGDGTQNGKMDSGQANGMSVDLAVKKILTSVSHLKQEVLVGGFKETKLANFINRFFPSVFKKILSKTEVR